MAFSSINTFEVVVAIDIGTTYSGYAFSLKSDYDVDPMKISIPNCYVAGESHLLSHKTSSSLLLDENKKFKSFGFEAESIYAAAENPDELYFFHRFKMNLYKKKDISSKMKIHDITRNKSLPAVKIFSLSIKALRDHFLDLIKTKNLQNVLAEDKILWVVTVPAIWPPSAKIFMVECAQEAGIDESQISIALEPEAGAICCQQKSNLKLSEAGSVYLVADLGGGTADLTVHEKLEDGGLKELHKADGVDSGGTNVDEKFFEFFSDLTETQNILSVLSAESQFDLYRYIEIMKRRVRHTDEGDMVVEIPDLFTKNDGRDLKEHITDLVEKYCSKHGNEDVRKKTGRKIAIKSSILKGFFHDTIDRIIGSIQKVLDECKGPKTVDAILLVGGFSESTVVVERIRNFFKDKTVIAPTESGLAILQGAVIFGYDNDIIKSRILTYSYGHQICREFDASKDEGRETITKDGEVYCTGSFREIVAAGEEIKRGEEKEITVGTLRDFQPGVEVEFYACPGRTPDFVDDPDCMKIGSVLVPFLIPLPAGRPIIMKIQFGGTIIRVTAMDGFLPIPCRTTLQLKD